MFWSKTIESVRIFLQILQLWDLLYVISLDFSYLIFLASWLLKLLSSNKLRHSNPQFPSAIGWRKQKQQLQGQPLGIDIKYRPGLTKCFDKSTKNWCSLASLVVEVYASSTIWNFFDLTQPQRPPTELVLKFNMSLHDPVKKFFSRQQLIKWY